MLGAHQEDERERVMVKRVAHVSVQTVPALCSGHRGNANFTSSQP